MVWIERKERENWERIVGRVFRRLRGHGSSDVRRKRIQERVVLVVFAAIGSIRVEALLLLLLMLLLLLLLMLMLSRLLLLLLTHFFL